MSGDYNYISFRASIQGRQGAISDFLKINGYGVLPIDNSDGRIIKFRKDSDILTVDMDEGTIGGLPESLDKIRPGLKKELGIGAAI